MIGIYVIIIFQVLLKARVLLYNFEEVYSRCYATPFSILPLSVLQLSSGNYVFRNVLDTILLLNAPFLPVIKTIFKPLQILFCGRIMVSCFRRL